MATRQRLSTIANSQHSLAGRDAGAVWVVVGWPEGMKIVEIEIAKLRMQSQSDLVCGVRVGLLIIGSNAAGPSWPKFVMALSLFGISICMTFVYDAFLAFCLTFRFCQRLIAQRYPLGGKLWRVVCHEVITKRTQVTATLENKSITILDFQLGYESFMC